MDLADLHRGDLSVGRLCAARPESTAFSGGSHRHTDGNADSYSYCHANCDADSDTNGNANGNTDSYSYCHSSCNANSHSYCYAYRHANGNTNCNSYCHADRDTNCNSYCHAYRCADGIRRDRCRSVNKNSVSGELPPAGRTGGLRLDCGFPHQEQERYPLPD